MALILGLISVIAFIAYFYAIGFWYVGFIPLSIFLVTIIYYISGISFKLKRKYIFKKYGLLIAWIIVMFGLLGVIKFFNVSIVSSFLFLAILNILIWISSYLFKYNDGKLISQVGYYLSITSLIVYIWILHGFITFFAVFTMFWLLSLAIVSFVVFVIGISHNIEKYMYYKLSILFVGGVGLFLYHKIENVYIFLLSSIIILGGLYTYIYYILSHKPPTDSQKKEISVRRILAGERVLNNITGNTAFLNKIYSFLSTVPTSIKYLLEGANILIMAILIYLYLQNALILQGSIEQVFYWLITIGFITNVFLLKKIDYTSIVQRLFTFIVINFAIYISLFSAFQGNIDRIVFLGIIRNVFCAIMVFYIHKTKFGLYLKKIDYMFWIFTTILALIVNIILLIRTQIVGELLFPIILLYAGIQGMILYYSIRYINKIQEVNILE